ncbi:hypothetical protein ACEPAG_7605 [Sanghuangporus baumii]
MPSRATRKSAKLREAEEHKDIQTRMANIKCPRGRPHKNALPDPSLNLIPEVTTRQTEGITNKRVCRAASADDEAPGDKSIYNVALASGLEVPYEDDTYEYVETPNSPNKTKPPGDKNVFEIPGVSHLTPRLENAKTCQISIEDDGLNISMSFERAKVWGLVTSTPQRETEQDIFNLNVQLSDGFGSHSLELNSGMTLVDLLNAVMDQLGGHSIIEGLSYESMSWSRKIGTNKFVPHFLDSQMEHKGIPGATVHDVLESLKILDRKKGKQQTSLATPENVAAISTVPITQPTTAMEAAEKLPRSTLPSGPHAARKFPLASNWL